MLINSNLNSYMQLAATVLAVEIQRSVCLTDGTGSTGFPHGNHSNRFECLKHCARARAHTHEIQMDYRPKCEKQNDKTPRRKHGEDLLRILVKLMTSSRHKINKQ